MKVNNKMTNLSRVGGEQSEAHLIMFVNDKHRQCQVKCGNELNMWVGVSVWVCVCHSVMKSPCLQDTLYSHFHGRMVPSRQKVKLTPVCTRRRQGENVALFRTLK